MTQSIFANVELAPRDPILGINEAFAASNNPLKVNLGIGVYSTDEGKIPLLKAVKQAEDAILAKSPARGYQPIDGNAQYISGVQNLLFAATPTLLASDRIVTTQALGGTGALKTGADYLKRLLPEATVYISNPSWENHRAIFEDAGFKVASYTYFDAQTRGVDFAGMCASLKSMPENSIVVLHACCHNPTGADLTAAQWQEVVSLCRAGQLLPFLDIAYQGFADGIKEDALAVDLFSASEIPFIVASSFSKSFSLYGERVGALSIITTNADEKKRVLSQLKKVIRSNYSNPPIHGGAIVAAVLNSSDLRALWEEELAEMRLRIRSMREQLVQLMAKEGIDFSFVTKQRGMFSYTGLTAAQVERLANEHSIFAVSSGRICLAALSSKNIAYVAQAISKVIR